MDMQVSIIGSGFVGTHFLKTFGNDFNFIKSTSKTSPKPIHSDQHYHFDIYKETPPSGAFSSEIILITLPFSRQLENPFSYTDAIKKLCPMIKNKKVIFTSSTSIYPSTGSHDENSSVSDTNRAKALLQAEQLIQTHSSCAFILRLGGICGANRSSQLKRNAPIIKNAATPVNLIHINDIIAIMKTLCSDHYNESDTLNIVCSDHPTRKDYYTHICKTLNAPIPEFDDVIGSHKIISNKKLTNKYKFNLQFTSPLSFTFQ